ncbi:3-dehydro-L-gulonate 2-dehydrogenase [Emticicia sp.]|uniref:3-dehydro-L-gulonate 2-dehydrogenase n=1 Tax=Emticicia sp. TaxID=1930953 RepID=UPI003753A066
MSSTPNTVFIYSAKMQAIFEAILLKNGFEPEKAIKCAAVFANNSIDGIYTHGVNRFPRFIKYLKEGFIKADKVPTLISKFGGIEQWDGNLGPGPLNAIHATETVMKLAQQHGIGCLALSKTNHWMRGGTYGWQAAKAGFVFIGWTNTIANMPAWGATDAKLGNNPLVIAIPYKDEAIVLDMAMSQFSFGAMELAAMKNEKLSVVGGYDKEGNLTDDPNLILESWRSIPVGYWKGAGLSLLLDLLAAILSGGLSTHEVTKEKVEYGVSQVFIAIDLAKLGNHSSISQIIENIINDYHSSVSIDDSKKITFPGERVLQTRQKNTVNGIPVLKSVWEEILILNE